MEKFLTAPSLWTNGSGMSYCGDRCNFTAQLLLGLLKWTSNGSLFDGASYVSKQQWNERGEGETEQG